MSPQAQLTAFAQSVYLRIKNRQFDNISGIDGQTYITNVIDFTNGYIDELENEIDSEGNPINWRWLEQLGATLGTATTGAASMAFPTTYLNLISDENRYVQILQDGTAVSNWLVVAPGDISNKMYRYTEDMVTLTGSGILTFSRQFRDTENGGLVVGDVTTSFPRLSQTNVKVLSIIKPRELLVLGVAKNASLPDIVKGALSPSYVQKYNDLLSNVILRNGTSSVSRTLQRENNNYISGVGF